MPGKAVGHAAVELPWLCPSTDSLIALADNPAGLLDMAVADPALEIFLLRFAQPSTEPHHFGFAPGALLSALLPEMAASFLNSTRAGVLPHNSAVLGRVRRVVVAAGQLAMELARETRLVPDDVAGRLARLAPLAWYAVAAVDPFDAADPLADPNFSQRPSDIQIEVWGLDHPAITRRLIDRWRLPRWVGDTIANLSRSLSLAVDLVAHRDLFAVVQLAVFEAEAICGTLGLTQDANRGELLDSLRVDHRVLEELRSRCADTKLPGGSDLDPNPHHVPLLRSLLRQAGENRRRNGPALVTRLEGRIDELHRLVQDRDLQAADRLRDAKLAGLAELAAGAGHEINNPLAIISSNAQQLLRTESDPVRNESLQAIVRQANRIAGLVRDLMHFARPPAPNRQAFPAAALLNSIRDDLLAVAEEKGVRLEIAEVPADLWLLADRQQLRRALGAVVLNGIEATTDDGWVSVSCTSSESEVGFSIDDNGPGLSTEAAEHAFDPFYSGRMAGRGRGLGLTTAWRLARQNGGELRYDRTAAPLTRFILRGFRAAGHDCLSLRSA